jgi:hypothetical protein
MSARLLGLMFVLVVSPACDSKDTAPSSEGPASETRGTEAVHRAEPAAERPTLVHEFITTEGEHVVTPDGEHEVHVFREGSLLNYRTVMRDTPSVAKSKNGSTVGPVAAAIDPNSEWFIYVDAPGRYWVFDGYDQVTLIENQTHPTMQMKNTDLSRNWERLLLEMPPSVRKRIPSRLMRGR